MAEADQQMDQALRCMVAQLLKQAKVLSTGWQEGNRIQQLLAIRPFTDDLLMELLQFLFTLFEEIIIVLDGLNLCANSMIRMFSRMVQTAVKQNLRVRVIATSRISLGVRDACYYDSQETPEAQSSNCVVCEMIPREAVESDIKISTEIRLNSLVSRGLGPEIDVSTIPAWSDDLASCSKGIHVKILGSKATQETTTKSIELLDSQNASFAHWISITRHIRNIDQDEHGDFGEHVDGSYPSPIYYAAFLGLRKCAELLLRDGADPNSKGGKYRYPILAAVVAGEEELVELLAGTGADINSRQDGTVRTAVHLAVLNNRMHCLGKLATLGADLNARDRNGRVPLHLAAGGGHIDCMRFLLSSGADMEAEDELSCTPVVLAAKSGQQRALMVLLEKGAEVDARTMFGMTALCYAAINLDSRMVKTLLEAGAYPNWRTKKPFGGTPLHLATFEASTMVNTHLTKEERKTRLKIIIDALLEKGADPSIQDEDGGFADEKAPDPELKAKLHNLRLLFDPNG
ncbi:MAG: hypothetical protein Q9186_006887 [Xanthomendoza sp. 1 TL-2023]